MRIVFMGTPEFAVPSLRSLIDAGHEIPLVVTQPDRPKGRGRKPTPSAIKQVALSNGIPIAQPDDVNAEENLALVRRADPEAIVVVAFGQILRKPLLSLPPKGCLNLHASLLPRYRGAAPIHRALINGDRVTGVTTLYMTEAMDAGDIILSREVAIADDDTVETLSSRLAAIGATLLCETLRMVAEGNAPRSPQKETEASFAPKVTKEEAHIRWQSNTEAVRNLVRGTNPHPGAFAFFRGSLLKIWWVERAAPLSGWEAAAAGEIVGLDRGGTPLVRAGDGLLSLARVQPADRRQMSGAEWARGAHLHTGERLT